MMEQYWSTSGLEFWRKQEARKGTWKGGSLLDFRSFVAECRPVFWNGFWACRLAKGETERGKGQLVSDSGQLWIWTAWGWEGTEELTEIKTNEAFKLSAVSSTLDGDFWNDLSAQWRLHRHLHRLQLYQTWHFTHFQLRLFQFQLLRRRVCTRLVICILERTGWLCERRRGQS